MPLFLANLVTRTTMATATKALLPILRNVLTAGAIECAKTIVRNRTITPNANDIYQSEFAKHRARVDAEIYARTYNPKPKT